MDLGIPMLPELPKDETDRNRTSPFAFTGNKFEFRAVGSTANCALPMTVINVIVAESLHRILDEIEKKMGRKEHSPKAFKQAAMPVVRKFLKAGVDPLHGRYFSAAWEREAKKRGLPIIKRSYHAFSTFAEKKSVNAFKGVLSEQELKARVEVMTEQYSKLMNIEAKLLIEMVRTQIIPAAFSYQKLLAKSIKNLHQVSPGSGKEQATLLRNHAKLRWGAQTL
jgi:glutamine synthetase